MNVKYIKEQNADGYLPIEKTAEDIYDDIAGEWYLSEYEEGDFSGDNFDYNITFGNEKIVFIKAGAGGSERGYEDKYIKMAERIHERIGGTVITASNPIDPICDAPDAEEIYWVVNRIGFEKFELYLVGVSDGAYLNLELARRFPETVKWIGINPSFVEMSELEEKLKALSNVFKLIIYGTKDEDFDEIIPALQEINCDNFALEFVEGADHRFTDMLDEFVALADRI